MGEAAEWRVTNVTLSEPKRPNPPRPGGLRASEAPSRTALALLERLVAPSPGARRPAMEVLRTTSALIRRWSTFHVLGLVAGDVMKNLSEGSGIDNDGNVVPALAVLWEAKPDKGLRFHREGGPFHSVR